LLIRKGAGSRQAESSKLKAKKELFLIYTFSFRPKLQREAQLINEMVQEKIPKLELLCSHLIA
jgi:hypothetical protein